MYQAITAYYTTWKQFQVGLIHMGTHRYYLCSTFEHFISTHRERVNAKRFYLAHHLIAISTLSLSPLQMLDVLLQRYHDWITSQINTFKTNIKVQPFFQPLLTSRITSTLKTIVEAPNTVTLPTHSISRLQVQREQQVYNISMVQSTNKPSFYVRLLIWFL